MPSVSAQLRMLVTARTTDTPLPITLPRRRLLGVVTGTDTPLALTPLFGPPPFSDTFTETFTGSNGALTAGVFPITRLAGGTRWLLDTNQAQLTGSAFSSEAFRVDKGLTRDSYTASVVLAGWQRGTANDVSLGLIVCKDVTTSLTYYSAFVNQTPTTDVLRLFRFVQGQTSVALAPATPVVALEGQTLTVQVEQTTTPALVTRLVVSLNSVVLIDVTDLSPDAIRTGRYVGGVGYCQGTITTTNLRLDTLTATVAALPPPPLTGGGRKIGRNRRVFTP